MATAVVRVVVDAAGVLTPEEFGVRLQALRDRGFEVISAPLDRLAEWRREIELIVEEGSRADTDEYAAICAETFGLPAEVGVITYISRGTDEDAAGVLARFGVAGRVVRDLRETGELVTVTISRATARRVPESSLHTALEAALNCEVRIRLA